MQRRSVAALAADRAADVTNERTTAAHRRRRRAQKRAPTQDSAQRPEAGAAENRTHDRGHEPAQFGAAPGGGRAAADAPPTGGRTRPRTDNAGAARRRTAGKQNHSATRTRRRSEAATERANGETRGTPPERGRGAPSASFGRPENARRWAREAGARKKPRTENSGKRAQATVPPLFPARMKAFRVLRAANPCWLDASFSAARRFRKTFRFYLGGDGRSGRGGVQGDVHAFRWLRQPALLLCYRRSASGIYRSIC